MVQITDRYDNGVIDIHVTKNDFQVECTVMALNDLLPCAACRR